MAATNEKWYFTKEQLESTPSIRCGYDSYKELSHRQQAANFIQEMGQRLKVSQLCINTAVVYMHRFYVYHSFTQFAWHQIAAAALFLAAKVEEQPRKLEYVIRVANVCRNIKETFDVTSERYLAQSQDLVFNENVLLQTLGFDVAIDHPHTHVVKCCHLVRASKDLAQTSYFMANNSVHFTTMCLQYKPTVVACFCIHLACKWSHWEIPLSSEQKEWFSYVDPAVTADLLQQLTTEFLVIFENCPSKFKEKIMIIGENAMSHNSSATNSILSSFEADSKKAHREDFKDVHFHRSHGEGKSDDLHKHRSSSRPHDVNGGSSSAASSSQQQREREYREKKERERLNQQHGLKQSSNFPMTNAKPNSHGSHHRPSTTGDVAISKPHKSSSHPRSSSSSGNSNTTSSGAAGGYAPPRAEPRDILREAVRDSPFGIATNSSNRGDGQAAVRATDKDNKRQEYLLKAHASEPSTNAIGGKYNSSGYAEKHRSLPIDPHRQNRPVDSSKVPQKHDLIRRHEEHARKVQSEKNSSSSSLSNAPCFAKPINTTSIKDKCVENASKPSVPQKHNDHQHKFNNQYHNGSNSNTGGSDNNYSNSNVAEPKIEMKLKEEFPVLPVKRPSLFSPESTPPKAEGGGSVDLKLEPISQQTSPTCVINTHHNSNNTNHNTLDSSSSSSTFSILSPLGSPTSQRIRNYSSSSEPELRPVMKKIDQVEGFENLTKENSIGVKKLQYNTVDIVSAPVVDIKSNAKNDKSSSASSESTSLNKSVANEKNKNLKRDNNQEDVKPNCVPLVNGIETNPTLISNLLKETPSLVVSTSHLSTIVNGGNSNNSSVVSHGPKEATESSVVVVGSEEIVKQQISEHKEKEHHRHKSKKKNKEKHKHKDKDKNKEERKKKKKHKDKDKHKLKEKNESKSDVGASVIATTEPIKITIQKDKIKNVQDNVVQGIKIKIPKDMLKTENIEMLLPNPSGTAGTVFPPPSATSIVQPPSSGSLKIKISKDGIANCSNNVDVPCVNNNNNSKKRERSSFSNDGGGGPPPAKVAKTAKETKQNGRHSYNKVSNLHHQPPLMHGSSFVYPPAAYFPRFRGNRLPLLRPHLMPPPMNFVEPHHSQMLPPPPPHHYRHPSRMTRPPPPPRPPLRSIVPTRPPTNGSLIGGNYSLLPNMNVPPPPPPPSPYNNNNNNNLYRPSSPRHFYANHPPPPTTFMFPPNNLYFNQRDSLPPPLPTEAPPLDLKPPPPPE